MAFDAFSKFMIAVQHKIYYVVLSLARFNLYANSYGYLAGPKAKHDNFWRLEVAGIAWYWFYFGGMLWAQRSWQMRLGFLLVSHIAASPVHVQVSTHISEHGAGSSQHQIVLSHFACSTDDLGPLESFPSRQLRTTMDVVCSEDIEFVHGGLHLQVTHHLFPRMPRHNLRKASLLVKEYCNEQDIEYQEHGWVDG
jgi:delta8-fatty-acid desaturase